jgi:hypothetical protein
MARHLRDFAPGLVENSTPDYCEIIHLSTNCGPQSHTSPEYGNQCLRWCAPWDAEGLVGAQKTLCEKKCNTRAKYAQYTNHGSGGSPWGSCCCMWGPAGGPGAAVKGCIQLVPGDYFCFSGFRAGCCIPTSGHYGCSTGIYNMHTCCTSCACRGNCGYSACYSPWYCCHQELAGTPHNSTYVAGETVSSGGRSRGAAWTKSKIPGVPWTSFDSAHSGCAQGADSGTCVRHNSFERCAASMCWSTVFQVHCTCSIFSAGYNENAACSWVLGYDIGYNPAMAGANIAYRMSDEKDNIPYGGHCFPADATRFGVNRYKARGTATGWQCQTKREKRKHGNAHVLVPCHTDCCAANAECMYRLCSRGLWHMGWMQADWCGGYQAGICGTKSFTGMNSMQAGRGMGHGVSGPRWFNIPNKNATMQNWVGNNWSYLMMCSFGTGDAKCGGENIHATGFGGVPAFSCAGPCYCGGPPGDGMVTFRYRSY